MQPRIMPCSFIAVYTLALLLLLVEVSGFVPAACRWAVDKANARSGYSSPAGVAAGEGVGWVLHAKATGGERRRMDVIDYSNCNILGDSSSRSDMLRSVRLWALHLSSVRSELIQVHDDRQYITIVHDYC